MKIVSSLSFPDVEAWVDQVEVIDPRTMSAPAFLRRFIQRSDTADAVIANGSIGTGRLYADLVAAVAVLRRRGSPPVVIADCLWGADPHGRGRRVRELGARLLNTRQATFCVLADEERSTLSSTWGVDLDRTVFTPYAWTVDEATRGAPITDDGFAFAGGDSIRDHGLLMEAATRTSSPVVVATRDMPPELKQRATPNVDVASVPAQRFDELLRSCRVAVVALLSTSNRSGGMQTYLNAMALGKPVIVTDSMGVRDYIEPGVTGIVVPPDDATALADAISWAADPANAAELATIARRGQRDVLERFTPQRYANHLLRLAHDAARQQQGPSVTGVGRSPRSQPPRPIPSAIRRANEGRPRSSRASRGSSAG